MKKHFLIISIFIVNILLTSCGSEKIAKDVEGWWETEYNVTDENGEPDKIYAQFIFKYDPTDDEYNGTFMELRSGSYYDSDGHIEYHTRVCGKYSVLFGDLILEYDLSSVSASTNISVNNSYDYGNLDWEDRYEMSKITSGATRSAEKEVQSYLRKILIEEYTDCNDGMYSLDNIKIEDGILRCKSEIYGSLVMLKLNSGKKTSAETGNVTDYNTTDESTVDTIDAVTNDE